MTTGEKIVILIGILVLIAYIWDRIAKAKVTDDQLEDREQRLQKNALKCDHLYWPVKKGDKFVGQECALCGKFNKIEDVLPKPTVQMENLQDRKLYKFIEAGMWTGTFACTGCGRGVTVDPEINEGWHVPVCECRSDPRNDPRWRG